MFRFIIIFFLLSCSVVCYGQYSEPVPRTSSIDKAIDSMVSTLRSKGIDTIIQYRRIVSGISIDTFYGLGSFERSHLLWIDNSKVYILKFVSNFDTILIRDRYESTNKETFVFLQKNYNDLEIDEILPFIQKINHNNIEYYWPVSSLHGGGTTITVFDKDRYWEKYMNRLNLEKSLGDDINLNYLYNKSTKLNQFRELILKLIK